MSVLIIILKLLGSFLLAGFIIGGLVKLSSKHRNPDISAFIERLVGVFGLAMGIFGLYYIWYV